MNYRFLSPALKEITDAAEFYEGEVSGLGVEFVDEVEAAIERILRFPNAWSPISSEYRRCNLRRFPYTLIYAGADHDEIIIVSVFHQSREPESWRNNL